LAALLDRIPVARVCGADTVVVMQAAYRQASHERAVFLRALLETGMRRVHTPDTVARVQIPGEFAAEEARAALVWSRRRSDTTFALAFDIFERLPMLGEAMLAGAVDEPRVLAFTQWTAGLSDDQAGQICHDLLPVAAELLVGGLIDEIKRAAIAIDPDWAQRRYREAVKGRRVQGSRNPDGSANVSGLDLPIDRAAAACHRIDTLARRCKRAGDGRAINHIRADLYLGMLDATFQSMHDEEIVAHILAHPFVEPDQPPVSDPGPGDGSTDDHPDSGHDDPDSHGPGDGPDGDGPDGDGPGHDGGDAGVGGGLRRKEECNPYCDETLQRVAGKRERRDRTFAGAQHVGRPGIFRAVGAWIGQTGEPAHDDRERGRLRLDLRAGRRPLRRPLVRQRHGVRRRR
jgi:hypothetical protein